MIFTIISLFITVGIMLFTLLLSFHELLSQLEDLLLGIVMVDIICELITGSHLRRIDIASFPFI